MAYQRADADHFYIFMGSDGLNMSHHSFQTMMVQFKHGDQASRENAKALLDGLVDFMQAEGMDRDLKKIAARLDAK